MRTHTENEVVLSQLSSTNLLLHSVTADVNVDIQLVITQELLQLFDVVVHGRHDGNNKNLARADPEGPLATKVLDQDTQESLEGTNNGTVDDNGTGTARTWLVGLGFTLLRFFGTSLGLLVRHVLELEVNWCLVVQLNGGTLELSLEGISDGDINLRSVESAITLVDGPVIALEVRHGLLQLLFGVVPRLNLTQILLGTGRELQLEGETEQAIDGLQEIEETLNFRSDLHLFLVLFFEHKITKWGFSYLILCTENVSIVLLELADTSKTTQGTRSLITVQNTKVCDSQW